MKKYYLFGFVLFWMILIYYFSQQTVYESIRLSRVVTMVFTNILATFFPDFVFEVEYIHHIVRKLAHFTIYLILGVLVSYLLKVEKVKEWKVGILAVICCLLFAISDETLQLFIYGRGAQLTDVLIDIAGASLGIIIVYISRKTFNKSG